MVMMERYGMTILRGLGISLVTAGFVSGLLSLIVVAVQDGANVTTVLIVVCAILFTLGFALLVYGAWNDEELTEKDMAGVAGSDDAAVDPATWLSRCALASKDGSGNRCYLDPGHRGLHKYGTLEQAAQAAE